MEKLIAIQTAKKLLQIKAIKLSPQNPFTWASGMVSPIYCDNRISLSHPEIRSFIKSKLSQLIEETFTGFTSICGVATAGIAHGALVADHLNLPFSYVRSKAKAHGRQNKIEGFIDKSDKVVVIEDLISTGKSSISAVDAIRDLGIEVLGVTAIFNYGFDLAVDNFKKAQCEVATLTNYDVLLEAAIEANYIAESDLAILKKWREDPGHWQKAIK